MPGYTRLKISTLGPTGTCSEYSSEFFLETRGCKGDIFLYDSFEEAIEALCKNYSDMAIVPSAYQNFARLVFDNRDLVKVTHSFIYKTPDLAIAAKTNYLPAKPRIATHPSPSSMVKDFSPDAEVVFASSNSKAAIMLVDGEVDACITNNICINNYGLTIIKNFGPIPMSWNIFERID